MTYGRFVCAATYQGWGWGGSLLWSIGIEALMLIVFGFWLLRRSPMRALGSRLMLTGAICVLADALAVAGWQWARKNSIPRAPLGPWSWDASMTLFLGFAVSIVLFGLSSIVRRRDKGLCNPTGDAILLSACIFFASTFLFWITVHFIDPGLR